MEYALLGPLEVHDDDHRSVPLAAAKPRRLLLCLLLNPNEGVSNDRLVEAVWGSRPPASAAKLVQVYVSNLRNVLGSAAIETVQGGYLLRTGPAALDVERFERLLADGKEAHTAGNSELAASIFRRALALWRGPALADVLYDEFASTEAQRLEELRLECVEERIDADLTLGRHEDVVAELAALSAASPLRERTRWLLMLALYRCGRQTEALDEYRDLRRQLGDELGLEPVAELRELERAILQQDPSIAIPDEARPSPSRIPTESTPLIGRALELEQLQGLIRGDARLITLTGAGGCGKSRLALAVARACGDQFANGVVLVELASIREPGLVLPTIAQKLGIAEQPGESLEQTVGSTLADRELLLVVDNVEHVFDAAPILSGIVASAPRVTVIATSRRVLHLGGEHVFPVGPLRDEDAVELFAVRARAARPAFELTLDDVADVRAICRSLDGLPLAIELAAARITILTPRALLERLSERLTALGSGPRDLPARQQTLRDTLTWSVQLLEPAERTILARLTVFPGGCTLSAAEEVCDADLEHLSVLVDHSLLVRNDAAPEPRFVLLQTVREYASELLGDERPTIERRRALHFWAIAESAQLRGPEQTVWLDRLDAEIDNLRATLDSAADTSDVETELRLGGALWRYWWLRGRLAEGTARLEGALHRGRTADAALRAPALSGAAGLAWSQADLDRARELAEDALEAAATAHDLVSALFAHTVLGLVSKDAADFGRARHHLSESAEIASTLGRTGDEAVAKLNLACVMLDAHDYEAAVPLLEEVLTHHEENGSTEGQGFALLNLGLATFRLGHIEEAHDQFTRAQAAFEAIGFQMHVASALQGLAATEAGRGDAAAAAGLLATADALLQETGTARNNFDATLVHDTEALARSQIGDAAYEAAYLNG